MSYKVTRLLLSVDIFYYKLLQFFHICHISRSFKVTQVTKGHFIMTNVFTPQSTLFLLNIVILPFNLTLCIKTFQTQGETSQLGIGDCCQGHPDVSNVIKWHCCSNLIHLCTNYAQVQCHYSVLKVIIQHNLTLNVTHGIQVSLVKVAEGFISCVW